MTPMRLWIDEYSVIGKLCFPGGDWVFESPSSACRIFFKSLLGGAVLSCLERRQSMGGSVISSRGTHSNQNFQCVAALCRMWLRSRAQHEEVKLLLGVFATPHGCSEQENRRTFNTCSVKTVMNFDQLVLLVKREQTRAASGPITVSQRRRTKLLSWKSARRQFQNIAHLPDCRPIERDEMRRAPPSLSPRSLIPHHHFRPHDSTTVLRRIT